MIRTGLLREEDVDDRQVDVWYVFSDRVTDPGLLETYEALMSPDERACQQRFMFPKHRHQYLITRALVRTTLSRYVDRDPREWRFSKNTYGRPEIAFPACPPLRFNVSHSNGFVVCAVTLERDIGIDTEDLERPGSHIELAERFFSTAEVDQLRALPAAAQKHAFFDFWTLKEAYIKARGMGLAIPLEAFAFYLQPGRPVRISFSPRIEDDPAAWQFTQLQLDPRYKVALAIRRPDRTDLPVLARRWCP
jgi:4'-phosphopantetheinyl transferase